MQLEQDKIAQIIDDVKIEKEAVAPLVGAAARVVATKIPQLVSAVRGSTALRSAASFALGQKTKAQAWGKAIATDWGSTAGQTGRHRLTSAFNASMTANPKGTVGAVLGTGMAVGAGVEKATGKKKNNEYVTLAPGATMIKSADVQAELEKFAEKLTKSVVEEKKSDPLNTLTAATVGGLGVGVGIASRNKYKAFKVRNDQIMRDTDSLRSFGDFVGSKYQTVEADATAAYEKIFEGIQDAHTKKAFRKTYDDIVRGLEETKKKVHRDEYKNYKENFTNKLNAIAEEGEIPASMTNSLKAKINELYR